MKSLFHHRLRFIAFIFLINATTVLSEVKINLIMNSNYNNGLCYGAPTNQELLKKLCVASIQSGHVKEAWHALSQLDNKENDLNSIISQAYDGKVENTRNILNFIGALNVTQMEVGHNVLYNEMERNQQLNNPQVFMLANKIKQLMDSSIFTELPEGTRSSYVNMKNRFPLAARALLWGTVCIESAYFNEVLAVVTSNEDLHRYVITWGGRTAMENGTDRWIFEPDNEARYFSIRNELYDEYVYPSSNELSYDHSRRRILTWKNPKDPKELRQQWEIRPIRNGTGIYIRNRDNLEYLYPVIHGGNLMDAKRRFVFSWRVITERPEESTQYDWLVSECSSEIK